MNKKLKIALKRRSSEQGFAIPIAVGLGLVMILIAATMIVRSQGDQITASAQKSTAQSLSVAEAGVTRVQQFLNKYRSFATVNYPWSSYVTNTTSGLGCSTSSSLYTEAQALDDWQPIGTGDDRFRVVSYTYNVTNTTTNTGQGTLVLEGQSRQGTTVKSTTKLQVNIPVQRNLTPSFPPPGVWARSYTLGNNDFVTDAVIDAGCTSSITSAQETSNFSPVTAGGTVKFIRDPSLTLPGPQSVPTQCPSPGSFTNANKPCAIHITGPINSTQTFPRTTDMATSPTGYGTAGTGINGEYIYYITKGSGTNSVNLAGSDKITITAGKKVTFYLQGNFNATGSSDIIHNCTAGTGCSPTNFQIFGGNDTTEILIRGNSTIDAFIFAPNASNSGINGTGQLRGSMWIKGWNASSANHVVLSQTGAWDNVPQFLRPPNINATTSWERQML